MLENLDPPPIARAGTTLSTETYHAIRNVILEQQIRPGEKLNVRKLSQLLDLSGTPVKEALSALSQEGLVISIPRRGYFVPSLKPEEVQELYLLRSVIEGLGARLTAQRSTPETHQQLRLHLAALEKAAGKHSWEEYGQHDFELHQMIWNASQSPRLIKTAETLSGQIRLMISQSNLLPNRMASSKEEHRAIVEAIAAGDGVRAEDSMRRHLEHTAELMADQYAQGALAAPSGETHA